MEKRYRIHLTPTERAELVSIVRAERVARAKRQRFEVHYAPRHGSWLNMAEIELSVLNRQCLDRSIADAPTLSREIAAWCKTRNQQATIYKWQFTTDDARVKLHKLYPSTHT